MRARLSWMLVAVGLLALVKGAWIPAKAVLAQALLERAWQETMKGSTTARPWPWADTTTLARLRAPASGASALVLEGGSGAVLAFGPGHVAGTPLPGNVGNSVVGGHRDTHFAFLEGVHKHDKLIVDKSDGTQQLYRVTDMAVVDEHSTWVMAPTTATTLTLVTCWPFHALVPGGPQRYVVRAVAVADVANDAVEGGDIDGPIRG